MNSSPPNCNTKALTSTRLLARNSIFSIAGYAFPVLTALISIPIIIKGIGTNRFGTLTLIWIVMGYFSLLDLGFGKALTKIIAEYLGKNEEDDVSAIIWSALAIVLLIGSAAVPIVFLQAPWLVQTALKIPRELQREAIISVNILAFCIPVVICTSALAGVLEAIQRFGALSICRLASGVFVYLSPLLVLNFSNSLVWIVGILAVGRLLLMAVYVGLCLRNIPSLRRKASIQFRLLKPLFVFGGWLTISNIIDPLMIFLDRFMIGAIVSMAAVAYYSTPFETLTRMWVIPSAISGVAFPAFSAQIKQNLRQTGVLLDRAMFGITIPLFFLNLIVVFFAQEGLQLWLGSEFAAHSTFVLKLLAIGVFVGGVAQIPDAFLKAAGRPDLVIKYRIIEFLFYLPTLWILVAKIGIAGAACAWLARALMGTTYVFLMAGRYLDSSRNLLRHAQWIAAMAFFLMVVAFLPMGLGIRLIAFVATFLTSIALFWHRYLPRENRALLRSYLN
jgi:O-antigen/teichoic acid export membrane protein